MFLIVLFGWLVTGDWFWFVVREENCCLSGGRWPVAEKPREQDGLILKPTWASCYFYVSVPGKRKRELPDWCNNATRLVRNPSDQLNTSITKHRSSYKPCYLHPLFSVYMIWGADKKAANYILLQHGKSMFHLCF
jgi:hypothetical protein